MNVERWVVLGVARPRSTWFSEVATWATAATVPVDFVKCMSSEEASARLSRRLRSRVGSALPRSPEPERFRSSGEVRYEHMFGRLSLC